MSDIIKILKDILKRITGKNVAYSIKQRSETITANTRLNETQYYSWLAVNVGTANVTVYGIELQPGEGLSSQSIAQTSPGDLWQEPIDITIQTGGALRMLRALATPIR